MLRIMVRSCSGYGITSVDLDPQLRVQSFEEMHASDHNRLCETANSTAEATELSVCAAA